MTASRRDDVCVKGAYWVRGRGGRLVLSASVGSAVVVALTLAMACSRAPRDPVERLLLALETAAEARDVDAFAAQLTADFHGKGAVDRAALVAELRRLFALYESVAVERAPSVATREGAQTRIVVRVLFSAKPKLGGRFGLLAAESAPFRFDLLCREDGGELRVAEADWTEEAPAPPRE